MRAPLDLSIQPIKGEELIAGESYDTWICDECLCVIALDPRSNGANSHGTPNTLIRMLRSLAQLPGTVERAQEPVSAAGR